MNGQRARAYKRVIATLDDLGPAKLLPSEQACIRDAADTLLFSSELAADRSARAAVAELEALCEHLVESGRWTARRASELADDVWACGPAAAMMDALAA